LTTTNDAKSLARKVRHTSSAPAQANQEMVMMMMMMMMMM
jgi:hypothetical protein